MFQMVYFNFSFFLFNMVGIYKITSPSGKVYIGQSIDIEGREKQYSRLDNCKQQIRLYRSLVKYGYSNHIFKVVEECKVEELNTRERCWQDFYNVLEEGLNLRLTETQDRCGRLSKETIEKMTITRIKYNKTPEGKESRKRAMLNTDQAARVAKIDHKLRHERVDYEQRKLNTNYTTRTANTDYKARTANIDWVEFAKKHCKPILQFDKDQRLIKEWDSGIEAGRILGIHKIAFQPV